MLHFGIMGSEYMKAIGIKNPKVSLLNIGVEEEKGSEMIKEAFNLLKSSNLNFVGNIEARDVLRGNVDVVVCDGFSGNVCLKSIEGASEILFGEIKSAVSSSLKAKIGALFLKGSLKRIKNKYDHKKIGGAPLLGVTKIIIKCHGNSKADSIAIAINQAYTLGKNKLIDKVKDAVANV